MATRFELAGQCSHGIEVPRDTGTIETNSHRDIPLCNPAVAVTLVLSLVLAWFAFGLAARKATRELEELRRRTQG